MFILIQYLAYVLLSFYLFVDFFVLLSRFKLILVSFWGNVYILLLRIFRFDFDGLCHFQYS